MPYSNQKIVYLLLFFSLFLPLISFSLFLCTTKPFKEIAALSDEREKAAWLESRRKNEVVITSMMISFSLFCLHFSRCWFPCVVCLSAPEEENYIHTDTCTLTDWLTVCGPAGVSLVVSSKSSRSGGGSGTAAAATFAYYYNNTNTNYSTRLLHQSHHIHPQPPTTTEGSSRRRRKKESE